jgi:phenylalanyl-tRNA synthetase alpha chain
MCVLARDADKTNLIESITLIDEYKKLDKVSHCYRITYRSMDQTLKNEDVDKIQESIRDRLINELGVEIR